MTWLLLQPLVEAPKRRLAAVKRSRRPAVAQTQVLPGLIMTLLVLLSPFLYDAAALLLHAH